MHLPDGRLVSYRYDPFGRRTSKTVAGVTTCYTYSDEGLAAEYDGNGTWQKSYGWKPDSLWGTDPVYQRTATGLYYYHNDDLGTPQRLSDESGNIAWSAGYTAFGNATVDPILSSIDNNLRFAGQYFDLETGLHYNYQRFYDPGTGRYTQVDPIGFFAEDVNLYRYVGNTPQSAVDFTGLKSCKPCNQDWIDCYSKCVKYLDPFENLANKLANSVLNRYIQKLIGSKLPTRSSKMVFNNSMRSVGKGLAITAAWQAGTSYGCMIACSINRCSYR